MVYFSRIKKLQIAPTAKEMPELNKKIEPSEEQMMNRVTRQN